VALPRWLRFATDRSQLIIIAGALVMVVAFFGFGELAVEKSAALVANERAQNKVAQLEEQNRLLRSALEQARLGQRVAPKTYQYFGRSRPGITVVIPDEPEVLHPVVAPPPESPIAARLARVELTIEDGVGRLADLADELVRAIERRRQP
jgi:hypothetical protein